MASIGSETYYTRSCLRVAGSHKGRQGNENIEESS